MDYSTIRLGKHMFREDKRTLKLRTILKELPPIPENWNWDMQLGVDIPTPMFANDKYGCCVIAGRAHQTLRMEAKEQCSVLSITDDDVIKEYFRQTGGFDNGLVGLDSMVAWRNTGWIIPWKRTTWCRIARGANHYNIYAFAQVNHRNHAEVKAAIYLLMGVQLGVALPISAQQQLIDGKPWDVVSGPDAAWGSWGFHMIYIPAYQTGAGLDCITWGKRQPLTWAFLDTYCDEMWASVDNRNNWMEDSPIDVKVLDTYLKQVGKEVA